MIHIGDCLDTMRDMQAKSVDLLFADPPFNIDYGYDVYKDRKSKGDYLDWTRQWVDAAVRLLKPTGSMFVAIGDDYAAEMRLILDDAGLHRRNWIVWHYTFGVHCEAKFGRDHTHIFYYAADPKRFTFNAGDVRIESERQRAGDKRANPAGRVPGDVWSFPRLPGNARERTGHPCQMPVAILDRIVRAASNPGDMVFDPFAGSGTTGVAAVRNGRRFTGCELSAEYARTAEMRIAEATLLASSACSLPVASVGLSSSVVC